MSAGNNSKRMMPHSQEVGWMSFGHSVGDECLMSVYVDWLHIIPGIGQVGMNIERLDSGISFSLSFSFFYSFCPTSVGRNGGQRGK